MNRTMKLLTFLTIMAMGTSLRAEVLSFISEAAFSAELQARGYTPLVEDFEGPDWDHVRSNYPIQNAVPAVTSKGLTWSGNAKITTNQNWARTGNWGLYTVYEPPGSLDELFVDSDMPIFAAAGWFNSNPDGADMAIEVDGQVVAERPIGSGHQFLGVIMTCGFTSVRFVDLEGQTVWGVDDFTFATGGTFQDCNSNGLGDECDLTNGSSNDCNNSGIPDECELASGALQDCNTNALPDECEAVSGQVYASGQLSPLGAGSPQSFTISAPAPTRSDAIMDFSAYANLSGSNRFVDVDVNGLAVGTVFVVDGSNCPELVPNQARLTVPMAVFNSIVDGGDAVIQMTPSIDVALGECDLPAYISATVTLFVASPADANDNGLLDACETLGDMDADGDVDLDDHALFAGCLTGPGGGLPMNCTSGDLDLDNDIDLLDFQTLQAAYPAF